MRRIGLVAVVPAVLLAGCFGGDDDDTGAASERPARVLTGAQAQAPASSTAGTLSQVADGSEARRRLGYANVEVLGTAELPVPPGQVLRAVLDRGAAVVRERDAGATAVQVGDAATVLYGGPEPVVVGAPDALAARLAGTAPETSAITPLATSAAQSCLGETLAQTILGPGTMGRDAALGVGLAESGDAPAGLQLRICGAPRYVRDLHAMEHALERRFGRVSGGPGRRSQTGELEIGEREIVFSRIPADAVAPARLLRLLAAGPALHALAWR